MSAQPGRAEANLERTKARFEEVAWLLDQGEGWGPALARAGWNKRSFERACHRFKGLWNRPYPWSEVDAYGRPIR